MQGEYLSIETAQKLAKAEKLEKNWNELKKWLEEVITELKGKDVYNRTLYENGEIIAAESTYAKMQELDGNNE